ncbi:MAG: hypothetical protein ACYDAD_11935 [Acidimicrobiales bacterium]
MAPATNPNTALQGDGLSWLRRQLWWEARLSELREQGTRGVQGRADGHAGDRLAA